MDYRDTPYYRVGRASDLAGFDRMLYRALEVFIPILSWATLVGAVLLSYFLPFYAALFIIAFDLYWLFKTSYLSIHLRRNWKRLKHHMALDWEEMVRRLGSPEVYHMVILPFYREERTVIEKGIDALIATRGDKKKMIIVLAAEERVGESARALSESLREKYKAHFLEFLTTLHPTDVPGEMPGKGSNISYAAAEAKKFLDERGIAYEKVLVSAFDIDTVPYRDYFLCLTWHFLTADKPFRSSFQPVPIYNNNIWDAPAFSRVVAMSATFWQMVQQERPEKLATFSSHAIPFKTLHEIGYWQKNIVSEDSRIFWNALLAYNGDYRVVPLSYPVSMDANLAPSFPETAKNVYKQQRRWTWGVENVPYLLFGFIKNMRVPFFTKIRMTFVQIEGFWSLATSPILIFLLGWLPIAIGRGGFNDTLLSYNLPIITRNLMMIAMFGLILSAILSWQLLPPMPPRYKVRRRLFMIIQWALVPFTLIFFGSIPGLEAQTRMLLGKYMGFWVTPKYRKSV